MKEVEPTVPADEPGRASQAADIPAQIRPPFGTEQVLPETIRPPRATTSDATGYVVRVFANWRDLEPFIEHWEDLAANALEPNPSYEWWMLIPALRYQLPGSDVRVAMVFAANAAATDKKGLCGIFPFELRRRYGVLPARIIRFWNHIYSLSATPLLRNQCADECLRAFFQWICIEQPAHTLVHLLDVRADSKFLQVMTRSLIQDRLGHLFEDIWQRALFQPKRDADHYVQTISTSHHRHEWRRQERRLSEHGHLTYDALDPTQDCGPWLDEFVQLEMRGWKGRERSAFGCDERHVKWLTEVGTQAHSRGRLMVLALRLDGKAVAMRVNMLCLPGSYAFKIAFDENFLRFSPGVLLELQNIRSLHGVPAIEWMDSLAVSNHPLMNRVWVGRTALVSVLVAPGRLAGQFLLSLIPVLRMIRRLVKRSKSTRTQPRNE